MKSSRRQFLRNSAAVSAGITLNILPSGLARGTTANSKLNIGVVGVAGRGKGNLDGLAHENVVAICDVDDNLLKGAANAHPKAKTYNDFRKLLDKEKLDAVLVCTPDHSHAVICAAALHRGLPLYCEKPLTRTVAEARAITDLARKQKVVTQIGTQIHAGDNYRRVVELVQSGSLGAVREVHVWLGGAMGGKQELPKNRPEIPKNLNYDLWLGPIKEQFYHNEWVPFHWRSWWAFGGGTLADFGCHFMDLPFWALQLKYPESVEVLHAPDPLPHSPPLEIKVRYEFGKRGDLPPVTLIWHHGTDRNKSILPAVVRDGTVPHWGNGVLFVGENGMLLSDYGRNHLMPADQAKGITVPKQTIAKSIGHHREWTEAIKGNGKTLCHFDYSGPLTETALLGNVAHRAGNIKFEWDSKNFKAKGAPKAEEFIQYEYRKGWSL